MCGCRPLTLTTACALPCVGSRTGGIVDVIEPGASGLLVAPGDGDELARALERLVVDPGLRERLGARGRQVVEQRFDLRDNLDRYLTLFAELSSRCAGSAGRAPRAGEAPRR